MLLFSFHRLIITSVVGKYNNSSGAPCFDTKGCADPPPVSKNISGSSNEDDLASDDESYSCSVSSMERTTLKKQSETTKPLAINARAPQSQWKRIRQNASNDNQSHDPHIGRESVKETIFLSGMLWILFNSFVPATFVLGKQRMSSNVHNSGCFS